jgi:hypothetical protein
MKRATWCFAVMLVGALIGGLAAPAAAQRPDDWRPIIRLVDQQRIESWRSDVDGLLARVAPGDYTGIAPAELRRILDQRAAPLDLRALPGSWRCRNVQISEHGVFGYPAFACRIRQIAEGFFFEKLSGSQRISGVLYRDEGTRLVLLGGNTVNNEAQRRYSGDGAPDDAFGVLIMPTRDRAVVTVSGQYGPQLYELTRAR